MMLQKSELGLSDSGTGGGLSADILTVQRMV